MPTPFYRCGTDRRIDVATLLSLGGISPALTETFPKVKLIPNYFSYIFFVGVRPLEPRLNSSDDSLDIDMESLIWISTNPQGIFSFPHISGNTWIISSALNPMKDFDHSDNLLPFFRFSAIIFHLRNPICLWYFSRTSNHLLPRSFLVLLTLGFSWNMLLALLSSGTLLLLIIFSSLIFL